jgi:excisionase family DNA binding protein
MSENKHDLLRLPEFAAALRITPACVRRWVRERKVTVVKLGRLVRIPASEIERIIAMGTRAAKGLPRQ